jgi:hypothetical protein
VYKFANRLYESLDFFGFMMRWMLEKKFDYVGSIDEGFNLRAIKKRQ